MEPSFDELIEPSSPEVQAVARRIRAEVLRAMPGAVECVDPANRLAAYGKARRMSELLFAIAPHSAHVNLQLAHGAMLPDPDGIVEGTGKRIRHVKCRSVPDAERLAVRRLIDEQIRLHEGLAAGRG